MKPERKNSIVFTVCFAAILVLVTVAVIVLSVVNVMQIRRVMEEDSDKYVSEISIQAKTMLKDRIDRNLNGLQSTSEILGYADDGDGWFQSPATLQILTDGTKRFGYERLMIVDHQNGEILVQVSGGDEEQLSDMIPEEYEPMIDRASSGESSVRCFDYVAESGTGELVYFVPFYRMISNNGVMEEGPLEGVMIAVTSRTQMRSFLNVDLFGGVGLVHLVDSDGNFLVISEKRDPILDTDNMFEFFHADGVRVDGGEDTLADLRQSMDEGKSFQYYFDLGDGVRKISYSQPFDVQGGERWFLFCIMPTNVTTDRMMFVSNRTVVFNTLVAAFFVGFAVLLFIMHNNSQRRLRKIAFEDPVTNGMSAARFELESENILKTALPNEYAMVSMDVDKFKLINDIYGSSKGDLTLKYILGCMCEFVRDGELAARTAADKFSLFLKYRSEEEILGRIDRMIWRVNDFNLSRQEKYFLSFSAGIYLIDDPKLEFVMIQDRANVARKNCRVGLSGFGREIFFAESERYRLQLEKEIENRMEAALVAREFVVFLQPKIELRTGKIAGAEALVRWNHPEKGLIPPNQFIPIFEKNGFIKKLDLYVFGEVCRNIRSWRERGVDLPVSVNLSRMHLSNPNFLQKYLDVFGQYEIPAEDIEIELTETLIAENPERLKSVVQQIHQIGFLCSIDDFGSGYSSLNLLKDIPVDILKLDRVFFSNMSEEEERAKKIVAGVIALAQKLEMLTVSEGVESSAQVEFLRSVNCDLVQGFVFSKPLPLEEFEKLLFENLGGNNEDC